jgi:hypothetical protein
MPSMEKSEVLPCLLLAMLALSLSAAHAQAMPASVNGTWRIVKILPTNNAQCWDAEQAKTLLGSTLKYRQGTMTWKGGEVEFRRP